LINTGAHQELHLTLKVPLNYKLVIDDDMNNYIGGINIYDCKNDNKQENATSAKFIMTENGLQCKIDTLVLPQPKKVAIPADSTQTGE
jgi:hypothetical protein